MGFSTNETMRQLSIITTVFLPLTFITGPSSSRRVVSRALTLARRSLRDELCRLPGRDRQRLPVCPRPSPPLSSSTARQADGTATTHRFWKIAVPSTVGVAVLVMFPSIVRFVTVSRKRASAFKARKNR